MLIIAAASGAVAVNYVNWQSPICGTHMKCNAIASIAWCMDARDLVIASMKMGPKVDRPMHVPCNAAIRFVQTARQALSDM